MYIFRIFLLIACAIQHDVHSAGLAIHPMEQFVAPSKAAIYIASNNLDKAIAVEVVCESWTITEDGEEVSAITDDLIAYPPQFLLKGNTYKKVRVVLKNPQRQVPLEKVYRVTIRELPISLEPREPGTFQLYQASAYRTSLYVEPSPAKPELEVLDSSFVNDVLSIRLRNRGNAHIHLSSPSFILSAADGQTIEIFDKEILKSIDGENMHAGIVRRFQLDFSSVDLPEEISSATFRIQHRKLGEKRFPLTW